MNGVFNVRFQIAGLLILIIIGFDYFRNPRRKIVSTTWFGMMLSISFVYICFDILTVYTLIYKTNSVANNICHRVFFTLLITSVFSFYIHTEIIGNTIINKKDNWHVWYISVPYIMLILSLNISPIYYAENNIGAYAFGPAVNILYSGIIFYIIYICINTFMYGKAIRKRQKRALRLQLFMWITAIAIQHTYPSIMLSGIVIAVSIALYYLSFEKQDVLGIEANGQEAIYTEDNLEREIYVTKLLEYAIKNDYLEVVYQPIYEVKTGKCVTAEALVRLKKDKNNEYISPEEFIPIAEKYGYIKDIGEAVFKKVCDFLEGISKDNIYIKYIEVNLSMYQITDDKVPFIFGRIMQEKGISPSMINLELTETAALEMDEKCIDNMREFKEKGCTFSIDDFGTGYSNLAKVVAADYELVKLDKSIIWPCFEESEEEKSKVSKKNAMLILENVVRMLKNLGVKIVAEGVETKEMVEVLTGLGVHYMQGYYFSKPICENDYIKFLTKKNPVR